MAQHEQPSGQTGSPRLAGVVSAVIVLLAAGWFALSHWVMGTPVADAIGEALGVGLALLIVVSVVGAVRGRERGGSPDIRR